MAVLSKVGGDFPYNGSTTQTPDVGKTHSVESVFSVGAVRVSGRKWATLGAADFLGAPLLSVMVVTVRMEDQSLSRSEVGGVLKGFIFRSV